MRRQIRVLPRELAEKIAAGEVVERPGSVIKELVENSLDAGATQIRVELEDGGRKRLSVWDDGHGISADEVPVALERHATSKIDELDDLWNLTTMGFRGEALPSIAAVSRLTIETRTNGEIGRKLYLEGSRVIKDEEPSSQTPLRKHGTQITVEDLFFNVPARLKFQKSKSGESSHIRELLERIALCNPTIAFTLTSEGRKSLNLAAAQDQTERVAEVLESDRADIETFESEFENITVRGWLDRNTRASNSRHVYLSVNGRMVRDKLLQQAVLVALRPRMMEGEYPKIYLSVQVPPSEVDVNVHPAKSEVRFQRSRDVFQVVHGALDRLARTPTKAFYEAPLPTEKPAPIPQATLFAQERVVYKTKEYLSVNIGGMVAAFESEPSAPRPVVETVSEIEIEKETPPVVETPGFQKLHYIGQLKNTYLLFQDHEGLVVIDQHAAHERVNYEKIKKEFMQTGLRAQPLLVSAILKCRPEDLNLALDHTDAFSKLGFEFEGFGDNCLIIRAAPEGVAPDRANELFKTVLEELRDSETSEIAASTVTDPSRLSAKLERVLATSACHSSVRAGQSLSPNEAKELALQMDSTESSLNCPHGRPASIRLTFGQIEGLFKRG